MKGVEVVGTAVRSGEGDRRDLVHDLECEELCRGNRLEHSVNSTVRGVPRDLEYLWRGEVGKTWPPLTSGGQVFLASW